MVELCPGQAAVLCVCVGTVLPGKGGSVLGGIIFPHSLSHRQGLGPLHLPPSMTLL